MPLSLIVDYDLWAEVFLVEKRPVKNTIVIYTFSYTQLSDTRKSLMANRDLSVESSHNPLVLGSNPSGPSLTNQ